jgi:hypothetical protein
MAAISHVFTIDYVAKTLGEDPRTWNGSANSKSTSSPKTDLCGVRGIGQHDVPAFADGSIVRHADAPVCRNSHTFTGCSKYELFRDFQQAQSRTSQGLDP